MARAASTDLLSELEGLRALARSLVRDGAGADDLVQDTAVAALAHPPDVDAERPLRPWLATVLRNRWRMDRRGAARGTARDAGVAQDPTGPAAAAAAATPDAILDRARMLERLAAALVALDEPFREAVILRYLDGRSAADIARSLGVPDATVRWRIMTGLERLRTALDRESPRAVWQRTLLLGTGAVMKTKSTAAIAVALVVLLLAGGFLATRVFSRGTTTRPGASSQPAAAGRPGDPAHPAPVAHAGRPADPASPADPDPLPGQGRATLETLAPPGLPGGAFRGRVINWSTGDGVAAAELTFSATTTGEVITIRSDGRGTFDLVPPQPGVYSLATVEAAGFLPYAPEWQHSSVRFTSRPGERVRGLTVFLFPAVDYNGLVVDAADRPVAGARIRLLGSPAGEQALAGPATSWQSDAKGTFVFHAPDDSLLEAEAAGKRGRARLDGGVAITHHMVIKLGNLAAADATIAGRVTGDDGTALAGVLVRARPAEPPPQSPGMARPDDTRAFAFATSEADGDFVLRGLDDGAYEVTATAEDRAPASEVPVATGTRDLRLVLTAGQTLRGKVLGGDGAPLPAFTLLVFHNRGVVRELVLARSIIDGGGRFVVQVPDGEYLLLATASGWAPSPLTPARPDEPVTLTLPGGATVRGRVVTAGTDAPVPYARVMREAAGGGASATPANAGTVTRDDGSFELTGIPPGPLSLTIGAGGHHQRIEAGLVATDGAALGPLLIALTPLADGEQPTTELVGIGVKLVGEADYLRVDGVIPGGGAERAGVVVGDRLTAVEGTPVTTIGLDGAIARIRGAPGTRVRITLLRDAGPVELEIERRAIRS